MLEFKQWFNEVADFGFEAQRKPDKIVRIDDEKPLNPIDFEYIVQDILKQNLGVKHGRDVYFSEIHWGEGPGAIQVVFNPYRGTTAVIRKNIKDLYGETRWICKKVLEVGNYYDGKADTLIFKVINLLKEVDATGLDAPVNNFEHLEKLVSHLASAIRRYNTQKVLQYEGVKRLVENKHYIIHFNCTGMGVQRQGQKRLDMFQIEIQYDESKGMLKIAGNEIGDRLRSHRWQIDPSQFCEYYTPTQPEDEIIGSVVSLVNSY